MSFSVDIVKIQPFPNVDNSLRNFKLISNLMVLLGSINSYPWDEIEVIDTVQWLSTENFESWDSLIIMILWKEQYKFLDWWLFWMI